MRGSILLVYPVSSMYGLLSFSTSWDGKSLKHNEMFSASLIDVI